MKRLILILIVICCCPIPAVAKKTKVSWSIQFGNMSHHGENHRPSPRPPACVPHGGWYPDSHGHSGSWNTDTVNTVIETSGAWIQKGKNYGNEGQWSEALQCFRRAVELEPTSVEAHYCAGVTYLRLQNEEEARRELEVIQDIINLAQARAERLRGKIDIRSDIGMNE